MSLEECRYASSPSPRWLETRGWNERWLCCEAFPSDLGGGALSNPPVRLLLVDDHEDTNRSLVLLLKRRGYEVASATSLAAAETLCGVEKFDVLICDMSLPDGNGLDLLRRLRANPPRFGGIVVSGHSMDDDIDRSLAAGFAAHLCKPVDLNKLDTSIRRLVH